MGRLSAIFVVLVALSGIYSFWYDGTWRYRLSVTVETPEGRRTGSGVVEIASSYPLLKFVFGRRGSSFTLRGEAAVVDLGPRGVLFALLSSENNVDNWRYIVWKSFPWAQVGGQETPEGARYYRSLKGETLVPRSSLPLIVKFADLNDPMSVQRVEPLSASVSFGSGVIVSEVKIEMVESGIRPFNRMTRCYPILERICGTPFNLNVRQYLPWWKPGGGILDGRGVHILQPPQPLSNQIGHGDFQAGL